MPFLRDTLDTIHAPAAGEPRIVSLVPSLTELLCDLGLAENLVGRSGYCIHPRDIVRRIPKMGGTKDTDIERIRAAAPTHLVANVDENRREQVEEMARFVPHVVVTHPNAPEDNLELFRLFGGVFRREAQAEALATEPYRFTDRHLAEAESRFGAPARLIDGEMVSWYGSRAAAGLRYLAHLRQAS